MTTPLKEAGAELNQRDSVEQEHHNDLVTEVQRLLKMEQDMRIIVSETDHEDILSLMLSKALVMGILEVQSKQFGVLADLVGFDLMPVPDVTISIEQIEQINAQESDSEE